MPSNVKIVLRNFETNQHLDYNISVADHQLGEKWIVALKDLLKRGNVLEKNYCWMGWPNSQRTLHYLCDQLNIHIFQINNPVTQERWIEAGLKPYVIEEYFTANAVRFPITYDIGLTERLKQQGANPALHLDMALKHGIMNQLHNHFELLQGTVEKLSDYYIWASNETKYAIRQLNLLCHEIESLCLSQRKARYDPDWIRPSQITTWLSAPRYELDIRDRDLFDDNEYDREFGGVYMHWCQIGKTLFEVWRDEHAPDINQATCDAITELQYYSGEFDIEWGRSVTRKDPWHNAEQKEFKAWLAKQGYDPDNNAGLSLGYLPLGQVDLAGAFGTTKFQTIIETMGNYLDIYKIEVDDVSAVYDYHWNDLSWQDRQMDFLKPGYRFNSKEKQ